MTRSGSPVVDAHAARAASAEAAKIRRLPWVLASNMGNAFFATLTFGSSMYVLYLNELGLSRGRIGLIIALFPYCGIVALVISGQVARFGLKRTFLLFFGLRKLVFLLILFSPWVGARFGPNPLLAYAAGVTVVFALCRAIGETAYYPWNHEFIPNRIRGRLSGLNSIVATVAGIVAMVLASALLGRPGGIERFTLPFVFAALVGLGSVVLMVPVAAESPDPSRAHSEAEHRRQMLHTLRDRTFTRFLAAVALCAGGLAAYTFLPLYLRERLLLPPERIVILDAFHFTGALLSSYIWGWTSDRYGGKPATLLGGIGLGIVPLLWLLVGAGATTTFAVAAVLTMSTGVFLSGHGIGSFRWFLNHVVPESRRTPYTSVWYAWAGLAGGSAPLLSGWLLDACSGIQTRVAGMSLNAFTILFLACAAAMLAGTIVFRGIPAETTVTTRQFVVSFFRHDIPRAVESLAAVALSVSRRDPCMRPPD